MKRVTIFAISIAVVVILCILILNSSVWTLHRKTSAFSNQIRTTNGITFLELRQAHGKLVGNGNGMQFFGAALVQADSEETISQLVSDLETQYEIVGYSEQTSPEIQSKYLQHRKLDFYHQDFNDGNTYYTIWFFDTADQDHLILDPNGH